LQDNAILGSAPTAGGFAMWLFSNAEGEVASRVGAVSLLRRYCEKVCAVLKDAVAPKVRVSLATR